MLFRSSPSIESTWGYYDGLDAWNTSLLDPDGRELLLDGEKGKAFLKYFHDLFASGTVPRFGVMPGGAVQLFVAGQVPLLTTSIVGGPWRLKAVEDSDKPFDARITLMPRGPEPDGRNGGTVDPHYVVMGSNTTHTDMAWEYMKYFVSEDLAGPLWDIGLYPARRDIWHNPEYIGRHPLYAVVREMFDRINFQAVPWNFHGNELDDTLLNGMMEVWLDKVGFEEGLAATSSAIREILARPVV